MKKIFLLFIVISFFISSCSTYNVFGKEKYYNFPRSNSEISAQKNKTKNASNEIPAYSHNEYQSNETISSPIASINSRSEISTINISGNLNLPSSLVKSIFLESKNESYKPNSITPCQEITPQVSKKQSSYKAKKSKVGAAAGRLVLSIVCVVIGVILFLLASAFWGAVIGIIGFLGIITNAALIGKLKRAEQTESVPKTPAPQTSPQQPQQPQTPTEPPKKRRG